MEILESSLISFKVLIFQLGLGGLQVIGFRLGNKSGLTGAYIVVILWTIFKTSGELMVFQLVVQSVILYFMYQQLDSENENIG